MPLPFTEQSFDWIELAVHGDPRRAPVTWGPRLELAAWPTGGRGAPALVPIDASGRFSQVFLARLVFHGTTLQYVALKLARDNYLETNTGNAAAHLDNRALGEVWQREIESLADLQHEGASVRLLATERGGALAEPLIHCRELRKSFRLPDPVTLRSLRLCKDANTLEAAGLRDYQDTYARYLCDPSRKPASNSAGGGDGEGEAASPPTAEPPRFFTFSERGDAAQERHADVAQDSQLIATWQSTFSGGRELTPEQEGRLETSVPCWTCEHRDECYGEDLKAGERLAPITFYGGPAILSDAMPLNIDHFADLLGGARLEHLFASELGPGVKGREVILRDFEERTSARPPWVTPRGAPGFTREVLALKLELLHQAASALHSFHRLTQRPHLDISPNSLMVDVLPLSGEGPRGWDFTTRFVDTGSQVTQRLTRSLPPSLPTAWLPAPATHDDYSPPWGDHCNGQEILHLRFEVLMAEPDSPPNRLRVETRLKQPLPIRPGDFVRLDNYPEGSWPQKPTYHLAGLVTSVRDHDVRIELYGDDQLASLGTKMHVHFDADAWFFRRLSAPYDFYGLSLLGFRCLLTSDRLDGRSAVEIGKDLLERFRHAAERAGRPSRRELEDLARRTLEHQPEILDASQIAWFEDDRPADPDDKPSTNLWHDVLEALLRIGSQQHGFSVCAHHMDVDPNALHKTTEHAVALIGGLLERARRELAWMAPRHSELSKLLEGFEKAASGGGGPQ